MKVAAGLLEREHHPGLRPLDQEVRDEALGVGLDRQLDLTASSRNRRGRVAAGAPHAVDLHADLDELPGSEALPGAIGAQGQRDAVGSLVPHAA